MWEFRVEGAYLAVPNHNVIGRISDPKPLHAKPTSKRVSSKIRPGNAGHVATACNAS